MSAHGSDPMFSQPPQAANNDNDTQDLRDAENVPDQEEVGLPCSGDAVEGAVCHSEQESQCEAAASVHQDKDLPVPPRIPSPPPLPQAASYQHHQSSSSSHSHKNPDDDDDDGDDDAVPSNEICVESTAGESELVKAVRLNHCDRIRQLVRSGCDCNAVCRAEGMPSKVRVERGDFRKQLQMMGYTALHVAVIHSSMKTVRCLLKSGADIHFRDRNERTALQLAAAVNRHKVALLLICSGAEINTQSMSGRCPLMEAVTNVSLKLTQTLLKAGADPDLCDVKGTTPLSAAILTMGARERAPEVQTSRHIVQSLIDAGCDVDRCNPAGASALMVASGLKVPSIVPVLLKAGANVNLTDSAGRTAFSMAIEGQRSMSMAQQLMRYGAATHQPDNKGQTPLSKVLKFGTVGILRLLLSADAVPHSYDILTSPRIVQLMKFLPDFDEWLHRELYEPRSLMRLCREVLRNQMSPHNLPRVESLGLPQTLNDFVLGVSD